MMIVCSVRAVKFRSNFNVGIAAKRHCLTGLHRTATAAPRLALCGLVIVALITLTIQTVCF